MADIYSSLGQLAIIMLTATFEISLITINLSLPKHTIQRPSARQKNESSKLNWNGY